MAINLRRVGEVADGSVTSVKLADNAVISSKIADGAVGSTEIADDAVIGAKIAAGVVDAELSAKHKTSYLVADETEVSVAGIVPSIQKTLSFVKALNLPGSLLITKAEMKSNNALYTASITYKIDGTPVGVAETSIATVYELKEQEINISALGNGKHTLDIELVSSNALGVAYNQLVELHLGS